MWADMVVRNQDGVVDSEPGLGGAHFGHCLSLGLRVSLFTGKELDFINCRYFSVLFVALNLGKSVAFLSFRVFSSIK